MLLFDGLNCEDLSLASSFESSLFVEVLELYYHSYVTFIGNGLFNQFEGAADGP